MSESAITRSQASTRGAQPLAPGFSDPVFESQSVFRALLDAMAYAGRTKEIATRLAAPAPLDRATAALCLTLMDFETPVWLDGTAASEAAVSFLKFHAGVPVVSKAADARFAVVCDPAAMGSLDAFAVGEDRYPDRSATVVIRIPSLVEGPATHWSGPGIDGPLECRLAGLPGAFWDEWSRNYALYPLGVDVIFTSGDGVVGLPRGIKVES